MTTVTVGLGVSNGVISVGFGVTGRRSVGKGVLILGIGGGVGDGGVGILPCCRCNRRVQKIMSSSSMTECLLLPVLVLLIFVVVRLR